MSSRRSAVRGPKPINPLLVSQEGLEGRLMAEICAPTSAALAARSVLPSNRHATPLFSPACWDPGFSSGLGAACRVGVWVLVRGSPSPVRGFFLAEEQGTLGQ